MAREKPKAVKNARMIATAAGFYGGKRIRSGEIIPSFTGIPGRWMVPAPAESAGKTADKPAGGKGGGKGAQDKDPETLSELQKLQHPPGKGDAADLTG